MTSAAGRDPDGRGDVAPGHPASHPSRTPLWVVVAALAGFLVGFAWQYPRAERAQTAAAYASRALEAARLEVTLAAAVIAAQNGEFEIGRQRASAFFTGLQRRALLGTSSDAATAARQILGQRDAIITGLARNGPASASVLAQTLTRYREAVRQAGLDSAAAPGPSR